MFDTLIYYGIPIVLGASAALLVAALAGVIVWRLLPKKDTHPMGAAATGATFRMGESPPRPSEPVEDEDDVGGSFTCFFCDTFYDIGAKDCLCYGCGRHVCLACTYYEEDQTLGGPEGPHTASDHPAYERHAR